MILNQAPANIARDATDVRESKFSIKATGQAFRILSDGLYSNKIEAVIRELCCNAWDSHVAAGKRGTPFEVHLPTNAEPYFRVKDFGLGLTIFQACGGMVEKKIPAGTVLADGSIAQWDFVVHEFVGGIFNTYFESTKTMSNDFIGALGLGSKSPFCYVDSFTVVSCKDGEKHSFSVFINEYGEPSISHLATEPTQDCNGVEITMPVQSEDFYKFSNAASSVLQWFPLKPKFNTHVSMHSPVYAMSGNGWSLDVKASNEHNYDDLKVVMGNIAYPINPNVKEFQNEAFKALMRAPFVLHFANGDLEFSASRESLSFTAKTTKAILARLQLVLEEITTNAQRDMEACPTLWDAYRFYQTKVTRGPLRKFVNHLNLTYKGKSIKDSNVRLFRHNLVDVQVTNFNYKGRASKITIDTNEGGSYNVEAVEGVKIYIDDANRPAHKKIYDHEGKGGNLLIFRTENADSLGYIMETLDGYPFKFASQIPAKEKAPRVKSTTPRVKAFRMTRDRNSIDLKGNVIFEGHESEFDITTSLYCLVQRGVPMDRNGHQIPNLKEMMHMATKAEIQIANLNWEVIGIRPSQEASFLKKNPGMKHVQDHLEFEFRKALPDFSDQIRFLESSRWRASAWNRATFLGKIAAHNGSTNSLGDFAQKVRKYTASAADEATVYSVSKLAEFLGVALPTSTLYGDLEAEWEILTQDYPLLPYIMAQDITLALDYVDQLDELVRLKS